MPQKTIIVTNDAPKAMGPYSQAVRAGMFVFASGQIGLIPSTGELIQGGIEAETRQTLSNLSALLKASGSGLEQAVRTTVYLCDMDNFSRMNAVYAEYFPADPPARVTIQITALPRGANIEIDCIALVKE
jgi:2-iminobutanoate/2-iminopropanoate deaminase